MFRLAIICVLLTIGKLSMAQEPAVKSKKELRQEKKERKLEQETEEMENLNILVRKRAWALEANALFNRQGFRTALNPSLNFVAVQGNYGAIQLQTIGNTPQQINFDGVGGDPISDRVLVNDNGIGGFTFEGTIWDYQVTEPKKENKGVSLRAFISTQSGAIQIDLVVNNRQNSRLTISWGWGDRTVITGTLLEPSKSSVYKAFSSY